MITNYALVFVGGFRLQTGSYQLQESCVQRVFVYRKSQSKKIWPSLASVVIIGSQGYKYGNLDAFLTLHIQPLGQQRENKYINVIFVLFRVLLSDVNKNISALILNLNNFKNPV